MIRKIGIVLLAVACALCMPGCGNARNLESYRPITDLNNLEMRKIGVNIAWAADYLLSERDDLILYRYDTTADMLMALCYKQLDAVATEQVSVAEIMRATTGLRVVDGVLSEDGFVALFSSGNDELREEFDRWVEEYRKTPEYEAWIKRIEDFDGEHYEWPLGEWPTEGKSIVMGGYDIDFPMVYAGKGGHPEGFELELFYEFCMDCGYAPDVRLMEEEGIFAGMTNGTIDMLYGDFSELFAGDSAVVGITASKSYREAPIMLIEIGDPDNLSLSGIGSYEDEEE